VSDKLILKTEHAKHHVSGKLFVEKHSFLFEGTQSWLGQALSYYLAIWYHWYARSLIRHK
jgi:hypothetical protein